MQIHNCDFGISCFAAMNAIEMFGKCSMIWRIPCLMMKGKIVSRISIRNGPRERETTPTRNISDANQ